MAVQVKDSKEETIEIIKVEKYMQKIQNYTLQKLLDDIINELKRENEYRINTMDDPLDIPFIISALYQSFKNNIVKYKEFIKDLQEYPDHTITLEGSKNDYDGIIDIEVVLSRLIEEKDDKNIYTDTEFADYYYVFRLHTDERHFGYCECTPGMPDYREDKHCCGHGCDAVFCAFELDKVFNITSDSWDGDEHDYWDFEDEFYLTEKELEDKRRKEEMVKEIKRLQNEIVANKNRLCELQGEYTNFSSNTEGDI